ncbi:MAG TPA: glycosyltransferase [Roseiflexaceae bacterium]|nr:glycosyltransferase [Roseiflexaceae bacterium]
MRAKHILILTADAGSGHRSAARALAGALERLYADKVRVTTVNPIHHPRASSLLRLYEKAYLDEMQHVPALYHLTYALTDISGVNHVLAGSVHQLLHSAIRRVLREHPADVVIGVFPIFTAIVASILRSEEERPGLMTVVTDLGSVHSTWFSRHDDYCAVPTHLARRKAIRCGLDPRRVVTTGIPVHPDFAEPRADVASLRRDLGWHQDLPTLLLLGGGAGVGQLASLAEALDTSGLELQLAVVAGTNTALADQLRERRWSIPAHVYGFVPLADLMHAADIVATKAGGLTVSEALAAGKPLLIHGIPPGQEEGNLRYVRTSGAGLWAPDAPALVAHVRRWLERPEELRQVTAAARRAGQPDAALRIARLGWELASAAPHANPPTFLSRAVRQLSTWV